MKGSESSLRAALHSAYSFGDGYPDPATMHRIATSVQRLPGNRRVRLWVSRLAAGAAAVAAVGVVGLVVLTLLSNPRGAGVLRRPATAPTPAPYPSASIIHVKQWAIGIGTGPGQVSLDAHYLPANSMVTVAVQQGSGASEIISTTADADGNAQAAVAMPASITGPSANFTTCVAPPNRAKTCVVHTLPVTGSVPARTP